jgi:hypothetical protein
VAGVKLAVVSLQYLFFSIVLRQCSVFCGHTNEFQALFTFTVIILRLLKCTYSIRQEQNSRVKAFLFVNMISTFVLKVKDGKKYFLS